MIGTTEAAEILKVCPRRVRVLCDQGRIPGAIPVGKTWTVPDNPVVIKTAGYRPSKIEMTEPPKPKKKKGAKKK